MNYESITPNEEKKFSMKIFTGLAVLSQVLGVTCVILVAVWMGSYHGGFHWKGENAFNFHPLFMILGMVFFYAEAILVYRAFRNTKKITLKIIHGLLHFFSMFFSIIGLKAVFDAHNLIPNKVQNLYSLHSWIGLITIIFFVAQWLFGFVIFLLPIASTSIRKLTMPIHVFLGMAIFIMGIVSCLTGITEKALWTLGSSYEQFVPEGLLINFLGLLLILFSLCIVFLITNPNYKRQPIPEDMVEHSK